MLSRRQSDLLLVVLAIVAIAVVYMISTMGIPVPTLPRLRPFEEAPVAIEPVTVAQPDALERLLTARELNPVSAAEPFVHTPAWPDYAVNLPETVVRPLPAVEMPDLIERQLNAREINAVPVPGSESSIGLPLLTALDVARREALAAYGLDYALDLPVLEQQRLLQTARTAALSADYHVGLPVLIQPQPVLRSHALLTDLPAAGQRLYEGSLNWADFAPVEPVADYHVGLPLLTEMSRAGISSSDYHIGLPLLTERAQAAEAQAAALSTDYHVGLPLLTQPREVQPLRIERPKLSTHIHNASLNWADYGN